METLKELLVRCERGEDDAVKILLARFQPWALQFACAVLDNPTLAPDVVQESFVAALEKLPAFRDPEAFPGWFRQIIRTRVSRANRGRAECQLDEPDVLESSRPGPRELLARRQTAEMVRRAVDSLPPRSREVAELFYFREMKSADIAHQLDVPLGTVKRRLHDARRSLRILLIGIADESRPEESGQRHEAPFQPPFPSGRKQ